MYRNTTIYCAGCERELIYYDDKGQCTFLNGYRSVHKVRYCTDCADDLENAKEMGYKGPVTPATMEQTSEEARSMRHWKELPVATDERGRRYPQDTFMTRLGEERVIDPEWAVSIIIGHGLATADVNRWLDTLRNPDAPQVEKDRARLLLKQSSEEYKWICEKRALVAEKVQGSIQKGVKVT